MSEAACELDRHQPLGRKGMPRGFCRGALSPCPPFLLCPLPHSGCLSSPVPTSPPTWSFAGFPKRPSTGARRPLGPQPSPTLSHPNSGDTEPGPTSPNVSVSPRLTPGRQPPGPALRGAGRRRMKPQAWSSLPLTFSSLCPFSESVNLRPGGPVTGAAQPPSSSV